MSMASSAIEHAAQALFNAEKNAQQIGLLSLANPGMDLEDAYAVQAAFVAQKNNAGGIVRGRKIGLTSKAMQDALKINIPDSGILFEDMFFENGATVPAKRFIQPRIEAEIAFVLKHPIKGPNVTREDVLAATDYVVPSLEILDTRILRVDPQSGVARNVCDTIADNAANAGIVLGEERHAVDAVDLRWVGAIVHCNTEVMETGLGAGVLDDPIMGIVWLANRLAEYGDSLAANDVVLSGSFIRPIEAPSGSVISADFGPFGRVSVSFE